MEMSLEYWWNDIDRGKPKDAKTKMSRFHFVHDRSHIDLSGIERGSLRWEAGD
jgi:hypothetical protein